MYYVYIDDEVDSQYASPVAAGLRKIDLERQGRELVHVYYDEGAVA